MDCRNLNSFLPMEVINSRELDLTFEFHTDAWAIGRVLNIQFLRSK